MEASPHFPQESGPQHPVVSALKVPAEGYDQPIYRFYIDDRLIADVGVIREKDDKGNYTYGFFNDFKQFAAADVRVTDGSCSIEWMGAEGEHKPAELLGLLPDFVMAAVRSDFSGFVTDESGDSPR